MGQNDEIFDSDMKDVKHKLRIFDAFKKTLKSTPYTLISQSSSVASAPRKCKAEKLT